MAEEDREKTAFITPWGTFCYKVMPFGLKNAGATYQRAMTALFHDMIHKEMEVYVDDMIAKSWAEEDHLVNLKKVFDRLRKYSLRLHPQKSVFGASSGKLLGFIVSRRGIEVDLQKPKQLSTCRYQRQRKKSGWAGYNTSAGSLPSSHPSVSRYLNCSERRPRLSEKIDTRNEDCQKAFDKVKKYLLNPPILVPPTPGRPLLMYLSVMEASMGCVLGQHDETGRKERAIYYLSKKFTDDETRYTVLEKTCCALTWASQRLRHYMLNYIPC